MNRNFDDETLKELLDGTAKDSPTSKEVLVLHSINSNISGSVKQPEKEIDKYGSGNTNSMMTFGNQPVSTTEIDHMEVAYHFLSQNYNYHGESTLRWWMERFWIWDGRKYREINDSELKAEILPWLRRYIIRPKHTLAGSIVETLKSQVRVASDVSMPSWLDDDTHTHKNLLSMKNGILDIDAVLGGKSDPLLPQSPKWFSTVAVDYEYDQTAKCPAFEAHVKLCLPGNDGSISLVEEFFGYCLTLDTSLNKMMIWEGEGANGKSVTSEVLRQMVGPDNCSTVPLEQFGNRFQLTQSLGKLVNICSDVGELDKTAEGILKQFTSGDPMQFDLKNLSPISAKPTAKLLLSTNNRPRFHDRSKGLWRRLLFLRWNAEIPPDQQNPLYSQCDHPNWPFRKELPGILNLALRGLARIRQNSCFSVPASSSVAIREYQRESNPARTYLEEHYEYVSSLEEKVDDVMDKYQTMCKKLGYHSLSEAQFGKEVRRAFPQVEKIRANRSGERFAVYRGLALLTEPLPF